MSHYNVLFQSVGTGRDSPQETSFFPFPEWEDEFKTLIFETREFNFTQVCNAGFSFFLTLLCFLTLKLELMN